ncbi:aldose 1-epimerase [Vibrio sp. S9_S30]|uniref:aldose 1-epimerase n=1 Tax=Vibrio sp. S9_S30 TaxID=2720226 RepID=UPI0016815415|nr:aldose 1-epimerase [Vibrio sp. S9_S30]MBD1557610.1 aldose 1-epimerase [Vibrio sp. S9_S30]
MEHLENDFLRLDFVANQGASIAQAHAKINGQWVPFLYSNQPQSGKINPMGMYVLVPFSNRMSTGGFSYDGVRHSVKRNVDAEAFPIHGNAWQSQWTLKDQSDSHMTYQLLEALCSPFRYNAELQYTLEGNTLHCELTVTNTSEITLPFGLGFHPWFYRHNDTQVRFDSQGVWLEDHQHLPTTLLNVLDNPTWNFASLRHLPENWVNNAYVQWAGSATIVQPEDGLIITLRGSEPLSYLILYSPNKEAEFFCLEPVSHAVDAFNLPKKPGLINLAKGEKMNAMMSIQCVEG